MVHCHISLIQMYYVKRIDKMQEILGCGVYSMLCNEGESFSYIGTLDKKLDKLSMFSGEFAICEKHIDRFKIVLSGVNIKRNISYTRRQVLNLHCKSS